MSKKQKNPIILFEGYKGGVGKSMVATAFVEYCKEKGIKVSLIDTDFTNPDLNAIYQQTENCKVIDIDKIDGGGWTELMDFADSNDETIICSMKAGSKQSTEKNIDFIQTALSQLNRPLVVFFVLGIQTQNAVLLKESIELYSQAKFIAVKNMKNGEPDEFFIFDEAKENGAFEGVEEMIFPRVHARVALQITDSNKTVSELLAGSDLRIGQRAALQTWIGQCSDRFDAFKSVIWG